MGSGFIYLIIIGMWAAYFLPQWLSKHEDSSGRAIERYKNAMQVVAENNSKIQKENIFEDQSKLFFQRRLIFGSLISLILLTLIFASVGLLELTTSLLPVTALLIYLVSVRKQVVTSQLRIRRLRAIEKITNSKVTNPIKSEPVKARITTEHWVPFSERAEITGVVVVPKDRQGWQPMTIPKPIYTTAAKVIPSKRIIDLTTTGQWSAQQEMAKALSGRDDDLFDQSALVENAEEDKVVNE